MLCYSQYWFIDWSVKSRTIIDLLLVLGSLLHCVKSVRIRSFSGPYFPAFGLNTNHKNSEYGHFLRGVTSHNFLLCHSFCRFFHFLFSVFFTPALFYFQFLFHLSFYLFFQFHFNLRFYFFTNLCFCLTVPFFSGHHRSLGLMSFYFHF